VALDEGGFQRAEELIRESRALRRELGDRPGILASLEGFAALETARGHLGRAARLFGAADTWREAHDIRRTPHQQVASDRYLTTGRTRLSMQAFESAWAEGRAMTLEDALRDALEGSESPASDTAR
jgi:hypothetical protein